MKIQHLSNAEFNREDLNALAAKMNEIITHLNSEQVVEVSPKSKKSTE